MNAEGSTMKEKTMTQILTLIPRASLLLPPLPSLCLCVSVAKFCFALSVFTLQQHSLCFIYNLALIVNHFAAQKSSFNDAAQDAPRVRRQLVAML